MDYEENSSTETMKRELFTIDPAYNKLDWKTCEVFAFLLSFVLVSFTCTFGLVGNYLSVVTLNRDRSLRTSVTKFLLTVLAVADMAFLIPVIFVIMIPAYCAFEPLRPTCAPAVLRAIPYVEQYGWALASTTHMCTVYATTLVAVHRYVYVCRPHDTERLSGLRRAKLHVALVPIFAFFYNLPRVFEYKLTASGSAITNTTSSPADVIIAVNTSVIRDAKLKKVENTLEFSAIGGSIPFQIIYKNVSFYLFMYIIPLTVLVAVTVRLIATLRMRKTNNAGKRSSLKSVTSSPTSAAADNLQTHLNRRQQTRDDNVTVVLIIVLVVFIVCQTPTLFQRLTLALTGTAGLTCGHPYYYVERTSDYLVIFNSCVNFVIYVIFAPRFRRILTYEVLSPRYGRCCDRSTGLTTNAVAAGEGFRTTVLAARASKGRTGHEARGGHRTAGTGDDYCSEMAGCYGASSDQPASLSKNSIHAFLQAPISCAHVGGSGSGVSSGAGCIGLRNMVARNGSGSGPSAMHASNGRDIVSKSIDDATWKAQNELSSSVSSAGSSSMLPVGDVAIGGTPTVQ